LPPSSTLEMEVVCSSETLVDIQQSTWCYSPEDTLHNHHCENVKFYIFVIMFSPYIFH
jgi:hypothetical protein